MKDATTEPIATIGENISVCRFERFATEGGLGQYRHANAVEGDDIVARSASTLRQPDGRCRVEGADIAGPWDGSLDEGVERADMHRIHTPCCAFTCAPGDASS